MKYCCIIISLLSFLACNKNIKKLPYYDTPDFTPKWELPKKVPFHQIRPFTLINQENKRFTEIDIQDKICIVNFFFTSCPGICPKMTTSMANIQNEFINDNDILILSHSVTPEKDSASVLKNYAKEKNINYIKWKLLTGSKNEIYDLGRNYYFVEEDEGIKRNNDVFLHTENFVLIDKYRHIRGIYNGLDPNSILNLVRDIKVLKDE